MSLNPIDEITIGICTYKRDALLCALKSLDVSAKGRQVKLIIVDNDKDRYAESMVTDFIPTTSMNVSYFVEENSGVANARNCVLDKTQTKWLAFIDDDELVDPNWLDSYLDLISDNNISFKGSIGIVKTLYPKSLDDEIIKQSNLLDRRENRHLELMKYGSTGNCLIDVDFVRKKNIRFNKAFNVSGGEDSDFFEQLIMRGDVIWNANAIVFEPLTKDRATRSWIFERYFNTGKIFTKRKVLRKGRAIYLYIVAVASINIAKLGALYILKVKDDCLRFRYKALLLREIGKFRLF